MMENLRDGISSNITTSCISNTFDTVQFPRKNCPTIIMKNTNILDLTDTQGEFSVQQCSVPFDITG